VAFLVFFFYERRSNPQSPPTNENSTNIRTKTAKLFGAKKKYKKKKIEMAFVVGDNYICSVEERDEGTVVQVDFTNDASLTHVFAERFGVDGAAFSFACDRTVFVFCADVLFAIDIHDGCKYTYKLPNPRPITELFTNGTHFALKVSGGNWAVWNRSTQKNAVAAKNGGPPILQDRRDARGNCARGAVRTFSVVTGKMSTVRMRAKA
jgi:hypothetical protein